MDIETIIEDCIAKLFSLLFQSEGCRKKFLSVKKSDLQTRSEGDFFFKFKAPKTNMLFRIFCSILLVYLCKYHTATLSFIFSMFPSFFFHFTCVTLFSIKLSFAVSPANPIP